MQTSSLLIRLAGLFIPLCVLSTTYLYFYPAFQRCDFPAPRVNPPWTEECAHYVREPGLAPFRLLALGDPQLEGDSSLPGEGLVPPPTIISILQDLFQLRDEPRSYANITLTDIPDLFVKWRKQIDLFGNDFYLAHQFRTMHWWSRPSHVSILGDLLGSQWSTDEEFGKRAQRFWNRVFKGGLKVPKEISSREAGSHIEILGEDPVWEQRIINIVGNHDIGYAGDINETRIERFETAFGDVNWDVRFNMPKCLVHPAESNETTSKTPSLHIIVLNSMNLDGPVFSEPEQQKTYQYMNDIISYRSAPVEDRTSATLLLTHIPLHKNEGVCVDGPFFDYFSADEGGGIKEQNHLSEHSSKSVLQGILGLSGNEKAAARGMGRHGLIVNGHDHEGCDVWHSITYGEEKWKAQPYPPAYNESEPVGSVPSIREITLRSMMGEFGGYAGLLSGWFDPEAGQWDFAFSYCSIGSQHIWWAVHVIDAVTILGVIAILPLRFVEQNSMSQKRRTKQYKRAVRKHE